MNQLPENSNITAGSVNARVTVQQDVVKESSSTVAASTGTSITATATATATGIDTTTPVELAEEERVEDDEGYEEEAEEAAAAMELLPVDTSIGSFYNLTPPSFRWSPTALAFANTTPWLFRILFPTVCVLTHIIFYYGQTADMWKLRMVADIDVWANATDFTTRQTFNLIGVNSDNHFVYQKDKDVQTFTYYYAIHHLWAAKGLVGTFLPRLAAVLLIIFSGAWPHIKLIWLQMTWFFRKQATARTTTLQWLSTLGKWSLADVLVVCVMVGVLNLDWIVDPDAIKEGIISDLPALLTLVESQYDETGLCNKLLKLHCENAKKASTKAKCQACISVVSEAYTRPDWAQSTGKTLFNGVTTSGGGSATLRVVGMSGIYAFCGAVIVSILLSLLVDIFDHRAKQELKKQQNQSQQRQQHGTNRSEGQLLSTLDNVTDTTITGNEMLEEPLLSQRNHVQQPLEVETGMVDEYPPTNRLTTYSVNSSSLFSLQFGLFVILTFLLTLAAVDWSTMERKLLGAGPELLQNILGVNWGRTYSLRDLMWTTGAHGGLDYMLMGTFGLFCVVGPVLRGVLLLIATILDRCHLPFVESIGNVINFIGAFCSWEVFGIAIVMVQMLMPSITNTIVRNKACKQISSDGSCFQVEFNVLPMAYGTIVMGGVLLVFLSCIMIGRATDRHVAISSPTPVYMGPDDLSLSVVHSTTGGNSHNHASHTRYSTVNGDELQHHSQQCIADNSIMEEELLFEIS